MADSHIDPSAVRRNVDALRARIARAGGHDVRIVAVTKGFGADAARAALAAGLDDLGENYAQELVEKAAQLGVVESAPHWHFIGRLQRNKVRSLSHLVAVWQSVDRPEVAAEIARRQPGATVLVQLALSAEEQKGGCDPSGAPMLVTRCREVGLDVQGLMGVGPLGAPEDARDGFRRLVGLADELELPVRSIGMSADLEVAVEEGSTMVRVGRDLFGPRPLRT
jgi:pyridoxal phosphate enzyme (YggS family)